MPIDPQAKLITDAMADSDFSLSTDYTPEQMRQSMKQGFASRESDPVAKVSELVIPAGSSDTGGSGAGAGRASASNTEGGGTGGSDTGGSDIPVRVYWPVETSDLLAGIVYFHGGGWVIGDLDTHDATVRELANKTNAVVVSVDYRLAPEHPYPAAVNDCYAATQWVSTNATELGIDSSRLAVAGDSAGGNLAAVVSLMARDRKTLGKTAPEIRFQLLIYPCCDMDSSSWASMEENKDGPFLTREIMNWFYDHYMGDQNRRDPYAAPIRADDFSGLPSALVVTAELDPLRDEGEAYGQKLSDAGVETEVIRCDGMFHGFFSFGQYIDKAKETFNNVSAATKTALA